MKKNIWLWALYDFANSFVLMSFLFYFSQWLVIDHGKPAWWYNSALIISSVLFIITAPYLGGLIDKTKKKIGGLRIWTAITFTSYLLVSLLTVLTEGYELITTIIYTIATYAYLTCFLYYTPMLMDLSDDKSVSKISGLGQAANSIGQVVGVLVTIPFVTGITLIGEAGRAQALLPSVMIFGLLALPMLIFYKEQKNISIETLKVDLNPLKLFKTIFSNKPLALFFVSYFLISDALITFSNNFPLYLEVVHGVSDTVKSVLTACILIFAAVGAVVFGRLADKRDRLGMLRKILFIWVFLFILTSFITDFSILVPIFIVAGILYGPVWAISRSLVGYLSPKELTASSYGYYVVAERFATFAGPAVWSATLLFLGEGPRGYKFALLSLALMVFLGCLVLRKVKYQNQI